MEYFWLGLGMSVLIGITLGAIVLYSRLVEGRAPSAPKSEPAGIAQKTTSPPVTSSQPPAPSIAARVIAHIMSRLEAPGGALEQPVGNVAEPLPEAGQRMAKPGNAVNESLPLPMLPGDLLPEEARDIIRFQAFVESAERHIAGGMPQTKAIEITFGCKRSGRPESTYARAAAAIKARSDQAYRANQERLVELVAAVDAGD